MLTECRNGVSPIGIFPMYVEMRAGKRSAGRLRDRICPRSILGEVRRILIRCRRANDINQSNVGKLRAINREYGRYIFCCFFRREAAASGVAIGGEGMIHVDVL